MELLIAIMCFFGLTTYQESGMTPAKANMLLQNNQPVVQYYYQNPDELNALAPQRAQIDRAED
ncbi:MAG: hypothetical protein KA339_05470 [Candidatus Kapabacteria bacterium]|nr:hypothetical protein [Candidatus Kapabacteria bacterium]